MSSIRSMPFPLGIHLFPGMAIPPNHHSCLNPNNQDPKAFKRYDVPIYLPPKIFTLLRQDAMKALQAYKTEAIIDFTRGRSTTLKLWKSLRMILLSLLYFILPDLPESDLAIPDDPILDFVNSQCHSSEDLDQALQAYQAYQVPCSQDSTPILERNINHHYTYHIAQASQAKHGHWWIEELMVDLLDKM